MKIIVKAKPKGKKESVERLAQPVLNFRNETSDLILYKVSVKESPVNGQANQAIINALAKYFDTAKSNITLVSGATSKQKIFEIK